MISEWVRLAITDTGFRSGILLAACRHLSVYHLETEKFKNLAIEYKVSCLSTVNRALAATVLDVSDVIVAKVMALAFDEVGSIQYRASYGGFVKELLMEEL